jgi:microcystin-dependent protein
MEEHRGRTVRKRAYLWAGVTAVAIVGVGALVFGSVPHSFTNGETLTADNLNGNFNGLDQRLTALESLLPAGTIIAFGGPAGAAADGGAPALPQGWLLCDGSAVSRTTYATLFAAIGINFGGGDGIATFNLPDLRGRFLRGLDKGAGRDPDGSTRTLGSVQDESFKSHSHGGATGGVANLTGTDGYRDYNTQGCGQSGKGFVYNTDQNCLGGQFSTHTHSITAEGGSETRPKNVAVNYLIKI